MYCRNGYQRLVAASFVLLALVFLQACSSSRPQPAAQPAYQPREPGTYVVFGKTYRKLKESRGYLEIGIASWYGRKFHGRLTSNGETYDMFGLTAAHKALPLPTHVKVTNLDNGQKVILRVNDRGPFHDDRLIDLSYAAAKQLGFANKGTAPVVVEALDAMNYPALAPSSEGQSYYLQVGAFSEVAGARSLMQSIVGLMAGERLDHPVAILQSEIESGILHKVWIGPIFNLQQEEALAAMIVDANIGKPIKVEVD